MQCDTSSQERLIEDVQATFTDWFAEHVASLEFEGAPVFADPQRATKEFEALLKWLLLALPESDEVAEKWNVAAQAGRTVDEQIDRARGKAS